MGAQDRYKEVQRTARLDVKAKLSNAGRLDLWGLETSQSAARGENLDQLRFQSDRREETGVSLQRDTGCSCTVKDLAKAGKDVNILKGFIGTTLGLGLYAGAVFLERKLEKEGRK